MSLATIIRLEFAYPGVGILAGDSLQYLSIATAHGVIMVFFMIMPSVFGAFGNFLLPTQLGVHDVAFPRLNSAAFWFLPGGLIMLLQLVCVDRRYQRMNCFNIRELQGTLKRKFFTDLVNSNDHREFLNQSMVGLRFKSNNNLSTTPDMITFYNLGTTNTPKTKAQLFTSNYASYYNEWLNTSDLGAHLLTNSLVYASLSLRSYVVSVLQTLTSLNLYALTSLPHMTHALADLMFSNADMLGRSSLSKVAVTSATPASDSVLFSSENVANASSDNLTSTSFSENSVSYRFNRFSNPLISYDYKCGNYLGI